MKGKLTGLLLVVGAIAAATKVMTRKRAEWQGLSEAEVREKLKSRMPDRVPEDKQRVVADKVVAKMRDRGVLSEEDSTAPTTDPDSSSDPV